MTEIEELVRDREYWIERAKQKDETISVIRAEMERLREELEKVSKERDEARAEVETWKGVEGKQSAKISALEARPEPSRLEIAAMIYAAFAGAQCAKDKVNPTAFVAFKCAGELIAASKEKEAE